MTIKMSANLIDTFDGQISSQGDLREAWDQLKGVIDGGKVASRKQAYLTFSRALKVSNNLPQDESVRNLWQKILTQGTFSIRETDYQFDFSTILSLIKEGKTGFDVSWIQVSSESDDLDAVAKIVNTIALESIGTAPGAEFFKSKLETPITFCMIAQSEETPIACTYGTFVEELQLFHMNFLGRRINYPGVHIIERLQSQIYILREKFPHLKCITLCVEETNIHAQPIYQSLGFKPLDYVKKGFEEKPMYFYGMKLKKDAVLPSYECFKLAYDAAREHYSHN
jgi:hypothetical protein